MRAGGKDEITALAHQRRRIKILAHLSLFLSHRSPVIITNDDDNAAAIFQNTNKVKDFYARQRVRIMALHRFLLLFKLVHSRARVKETLCVFFLERGKLCAVTEAARRV